MARETVPIGGVFQHKGTGRWFKVLPAVPGTLAVIHGYAEGPYADYAQRGDEKYWASALVANERVQPGAVWMVLEQEKLRPAVGDTLRLTDALDHPGLLVNLVGSDRGWDVLPDRKVASIRLPRDTCSPTGKTLEQWVDVTGDRGPPTPPIDLTPLRDCWPNLTRSWGQALAIHHHSANWNYVYSWAHRRLYWFRYLVHNAADNWRLAALVRWDDPGTSTTLNRCLNALIAADRAEAGGK